MLLRSSSTPILGSLLSTSLHFSENHPPINHHHSNTTLSCHFSPASDSSDRDRASSGFRRTRSEGNLGNLLSDQPDDPHHHHQSSLGRSSSRRPNPTLETIPSFAIYNNSSGFEEEGDQQDQEQMDGQQIPITVGGIMGREFSFAGEGEKQDKICAASGKAAPPLFLARGLGIDRLGSELFNVGGIGGFGGDIGGSGGNHPVLTDSGGGGRTDIEMYYKTMVEEDPTNALFLCNYAQFLYQSKGDLRRAEEYYSRAILAEPGAGEILSQYAKLTWELHRDEERASTYFEQSVQAAPQDSHVLAAYAGFLWEMEEDEVEDEQSQDYAGPSADSLDQLTVSY